MEAYARDLLAVLDHFGLERAVLVGHSLGGYAVARFAADHPRAGLRRSLLIDGGLSAPMPADVDPQAVVAAVLGPALARLKHDDSRAARRITTGGARIRRSRTATCPITT